MTIEKNLIIEQHRDSYRQVVGPLSQELGLVTPEHEEILFYPTPHHIPELHSLRDRMETIVWRSGQQVDPREIAQGAPRINAAYFVGQLADFAVREANRPLGAYEYAKTIESLCDASLARVRQIRGQTAPVTQAPASFQWGAAQHTSYFAPKKVA